MLIESRLSFQCISFRLNALFHAFPKSVLPTDLLFLVPSTITQCQVSVQIDQCIIKQNTEHRINDIVDLR